jgi:hypothetical protein
MACPAVVTAPTAAVAASDMPCAISDHSAPYVRPVSTRVSAADIAIAAAAWACSAACCAARNSLAVCAFAAFSSVAFADADAEPARIR